LFHFRNIAFIITHLNLNNISVSIVPREFFIKFKLGRFILSIVPEIKVPFKLWAHVIYRCWIYIINWHSIYLTDWVELTHVFNWFQNLFFTPIFIKDILRLGGRSSLDLTITLSITIDWWVKLDAYFLSSFIGSLVSKFSFRDH
jgi:hypothetical protein